MNELPRMKDDGLLTPEVGGWAEKKYRHVHHYADIFSTSMKNKWPCRVYLDLFAGAGRSRLRDSGAIVPSSPLLALGLKDPFDKYIFCDAEPSKLDALRQRVTRDHPSANVQLLACDVNESVDEVLASIPKHRPDFGVLTFCFADPYGLRNLRFATIERLASRRVDFLVLIPSGMEVRRFWEELNRPDNPALDDFLGTSAWREEARTTTLDPLDFVTDQYGLRMKALGYHYAGLSEALLVRSTEKNLALYDLVLFSRSKLGEKFWRDARKYADAQLDLFG